MSYEDEDIVDCMPQSPYGGEYDADTTIRSEKTMNVSFISVSDSEQVSMSRLALRNFLCGGSRQGFSDFMVKEVASGNEAHPFISNPMSESHLRKLLRRLVSSFLRKAFSKLNAQELEIPEKYDEACTSVSDLNTELVDSIAVVANFPAEITSFARNNCIKYNIGHKNVSTVSDVAGSACCVDDCLDRTAHPLHIVIHEGKYDETFDFDGTADRTAKVLTLCKEHALFFELMSGFIHMDWNVYNNCLAMVRKYNKDPYSEPTFDSFLEWLPKCFQQRIVVSYMAKYNLLWAFGTTDEWSQRGFTLFDILTLNK